MRSKFWILLLCLQAFSVSAVAQNPAKRQLVMQVSNGGFVAFRSETPGAKSQPDSNSLAALRRQISMGTYNPANPIINTRSFGGRAAAHGALHLDNYLDDLPCLSAEMRLHGTLKPLIPRHFVNTAGRRRTSSPAAVRRPV